MYIVEKTQAVQGTLRDQLKGFFDFIRKQGVITLAIAFILGTAVTRVINALVTDIVNPLIGLVLGSAEGLAAMSFTVGKVTILWGHFIYTLFDFAIIAAVIYYTVKFLKLDTPDKKE